MNHITIYTTATQRERERERERYYYVIYAIPIFCKAIGVPRTPLSALRAGFLLSTEDL